jgi:hypothetical protein
MRYKVTIDGKPNILTLCNKSGSGYQYNTIGNKSGHSFPRPLRLGEKIKVNGHIYHIKEKLNGLQ